MQHERIFSYDVARSVAIILVFFGHSLGRSTENGTILLVLRTLSPGLTMSVLGFLSAALLTHRREDSGAFLFSRITRLFIPLWMCLVAVLTVQYVFGSANINQHTLMHFMGLSGFFGPLLVESKTSVGAGLWFVTVIFLMYLLLPVLRKLFEHENGFFHMLSALLFLTFLEFVTYNTQSTWNVVMSFCLGVYMSVTGKLALLHAMRLRIAIIFSSALLLTCALATANVIPYWVRNFLFSLYPLAFIPLVCWVSIIFPASGRNAVVCFSAFSYEFYILHFYLIGTSVWTHLPANIGIVGHMTISFIATCIASFCVHFAADYLRRSFDRYIVSDKQARRTLLT